MIQTAQGDRENEIGSKQMKERKKKNKRILFLMRFYFLFFSFPILI